MNDKETIRLLSCLLIFLATIAIIFGTRKEAAELPAKEDAGAADAPSFEDLLDAIEWVESKGHADAKGDLVSIPCPDGIQGCLIFHQEYQAVGAFQIHKIYVDDVNRIQRLQGGNKRWFIYQERWNKKASREMVTIYLKHYGGTFEEMARKHNGGPDGHNKPSTVAYWKKVKARMEESK